MTSIHAGSSAVPAERADGARTRVWGLDVAGLHERWWAGRGVQVIRRGQEQRIEPEGPELFLLVEPEDLVHFEPADVARRLAWLKPRIMRVRVVDESGESSVERVTLGEGGRVESVRRVYRPTLRRSTRVLLSADPRVARAWSFAESRKGALKALVRGDARAEVAVAETSGHALRADECADEREYLGILLRKWRTPGATVPGVFEFTSGVFAHESTRVDPGARLIGPAWLGAGSALDNASVVVGPAIACDAGSEFAPGPIPWSEAISPAFRLRPRLPGRPGWPALKRGFDVLFSLAVLAITLPLYPVIMLAIVVEDGRPVFFAHTRQTRGGRNFPCLKFRTMCRNAESMKAELARKNQADGPQFFIENDPRLLRCGRWLRRFQLDELPQFLNVLAGHMSVVGPRPSPDKENQYCPAWREARLSVRPGVTGLWQVRRTRAPETDFQEWIRYDLEYVQHQGWRLDLWIIWKTLAHMIGG